MKEQILRFLKVLGKFALLILIWSSGIAILNNFDKNISAIGKPTSSFLFEFIPLIFILIPSILLWKFLDKGKIKDLGFYSSNYLDNLLKGLVLGLFWIFLTIIGLYATCTIRWNFNLSIGATSLFIYFLILLLNTIMQEILCRGYLYKVIENSYNSNIAVITTTILFALLHPGAFEAGWVGIVNILGAGFIFGVTRKMTGNLIMPIAIHITWNFIDSILLGTSPLGIYPHLDWLIVQGTEIFTGGKDGLSVSIIVVFTLPIIFAILYFDLLKIRKKNLQ
jgi:uncharacterized protein